MSRRLGDVAISGSGPAADVLRRFGVNARQLAAMRPEEAFQVLLGVFEQITNPMERASVAVDLFGKAGMNMIGVVKDGRSAVNALGEEGKRVGFAFGTVAGEKAEEARVSMLKLQLAGEGFANMLAVQLSPYLTLIVDKYYQFSYAGTKSASFISQSMEWVTSAVGLVVDTVLTLKTAWDGVRLVFDGLVAGADPWIRSDPLWGENSRRHAGEGVASGPE